jgi:hypothetical protein
MDVQVTLRPTAMAIFVIPVRDQSVAARPPGSRLGPKVIIPSTRPEAGSQFLSAASLRPLRTGLKSRCHIWLDARESSTWRISPVHMVTLQV